MDIKFSKFDVLREMIEEMIKEVLHKKTLIPHIEVVPTMEREVEQRSTLTEKRPTYVEQQLFVEREVREEENPYVQVEQEILVNEDILQQEEVDYITPIVEEKKDRLPEIYPVGLVHGTYIVCQNEQGMYLIDQHAAKERINYEYYLKKLGHPNEAVTSMLFPLTMECSNSEFILLKQHFDLFTKLGFKIEEFGVNSIIVKEHPTWLPKGYEEQAIRKIMEVILACDKNFSIEKFNEKTATMLSCKMAIKANTNITLEEMEHLINDLRACDNPFNCPHGRPTLIYYTKYDLEKLFKRSGFETKA